MITITVHSNFLDSFFVTMLASEAKQISLVDG